MTSFDFWTKKEKFLILEVGDEGTAGFLLNLDADKKLNLEKTWASFSWPKLSKHLRRHLEKWKVVVSAHPSLASTVILPIKLERESSLAEHPLTNIELENLLVQATAKIFTQVRGEASRELGVDELDTILIDNRVSNFKIDNHHVMNPIDFRAKKIEAVLELTLTTRSIFDDWKNQFSIGETKNFFFTESARAELFTLKKVKSPPLNLIILNDHAASQFFRLEKAAVGELIHRRRLRWSSNQILNTIAANLSVSVSVAGKLYSLYVKKELSPRISRHFNAILKPVISSLLRQLHSSRFKGTVYLDTPLPLPPSFPRRSGRLVFEKLPFESLTEKLGFKVDPALWLWSEGQIFKRLAPFLEFYYNNEDLAINHWLRRRLHWLGSNR